jgi:hypothetical protein
MRKKSRAYLSNSRRKYDHFHRDRNRTMEDYNFAEDILHGLADKLETQQMLAEVNQRTLINLHDISLVLHAVADIFRGD